MATHPALHPDRLVGFLAELYDAIASEHDAGSGANVFMQKLVDQAAERNLTTGELAVPEHDPEEGRLDDRGEHAKQLHDWAFALTGATAKARAALSQIGLSDGEARGLDGTVQPDRVGELVAEVTDRLAREAE